MVQGGAAFVAGLMASCIVLGAAPAPVHAENIAESAYDLEVAVQEQKGMLEFTLQQQENAKKAAIFSQRQRLAAEAAKVQTELQMKLIEQKANAEGAKRKGDLRTAESSEARAQELEEKTQQVIKTAAQISSQLDRMELIERAKVQATKQALDRAAQSTDETVNLRLNKWLESIGRPVLR